MHAHRMLNISVMVLLTLLVFATCKPRQAPSTADDTHFFQIENYPGNREPSKEIEGLRNAPIIADSLKADQQAKDPECPFTVETFVRAETGTNCDTYRAEVAGSSKRCVKECDEKARLGEAIASAQITCADFCKKKNCPGPRYQPPEKCAVSRCFDHQNCPANCPKLNTCYLLQEQRVWNCICLDA